MAVEQLQLNYASLQKENERLRSKVNLLRKMRRFRASREKCARVAKRPADVKNGSRMRERPLASSPDAFSNQDSLSCLIVKVKLVTSLIALSKTTILSKCHNARSRSRVRNHRNHIARCTKEVSYEQRAKGNAGCGWGDLCDVASNALERAVQVFCRSSRTRKTSTSSIGIRPPSP